MCTYMYIVCSVSQYLQESSTKRLDEGKRWYIFRFLEGPVPGGKGSSQGHLTQGKDEVTNPEQTKEMVDLNTKEEAEGRNGGN